MRRLLVLLGLAFLVHPATAGTLAGVTLPEAITVEGKSLVLNGMGIRKATILNVKVYVAGLYVENKSRSADEIMSTGQVRRLDMVLLRGVERDDIVDVWRKGLKNNGADMAKLKLRFDVFASWMSDLKQRDTLTFLYVPGRGVTVILKGTVKGTIGGADFATALFSIWFGREPADEDLKESLLGK